ncbi:hypothetical protein C4544_05230 [candidate division WS5 bacterium]|uniref:Uncharacterized protein n=1 Tax=candidate division WS5 bacterium TaxID=2093353 RepID=A0A419DB67_9BACT|nr:MAG: hypothetical protein C4544_05230 [candidate division WS5 bacterium]
MQLKPAQITNFQQLITPSAVSKSLMPLEAVQESLNFDFDVIGAVKLRKGLTRLGNQISAGTNIVGLYEFRDSGSGSNNQIIAVNGTVAYYLSGSTWTSKRTSLTSGAKARFTTFLDYVFMVNGNEATAIWDGNPSNSFVTTGNASGAPIGQFIENFRSRVWIAGNSTYPDRVYYSSLPSAVATPVITWDTTVTGGQWFDISPSDGENITGLKRDKSTLLVFKQNHIYRIASINETEPDPKINVGTYSNESIVETENGIYFHHPTGFYRYLNGGAQRISQPIQDIVEAVTLANYDEITGWADGDHVYWSVGDITYKGVTYSNCVVRYTISSQTWTHRSYPSQIRFASKYNDGSTLFNLVGDSAGNVLKVNVGNADNGTPISYSFITRPYTLDGFFSTRKNVSKLSAIHEGAQGGKLEWQSDNMLTNEWNKIGVIDEQIMKPKTVDIKGREIKFRLSGASSGEPFTFYGWEALEGTTELIG